MKTSTYRYITQIMSVLEEMQNDDVHSYFPNVYEIINVSQPFNDHKTCIHTCDMFLKDKLDEINSSNNDKYGIVWEYNPKYKSIIIGDKDDKMAIDNTSSWNPNELVKYHIVKLSDLKKKKSITSILVSTISIEPGEINVSIH